MRMTLKYEDAGMNRKSFDSSFFPFTLEERSWKTKQASFVNLVRVLGYAYPRLSPTNRSTSKDPIYALQSLPRTPYS
jgi:hypothetical protein